MECNQNGFSNYVIAKSPHSMNSIFVRFLILSAILFFHIKSYASEIDSIKYKKEWLLIYPFDQKAERQYDNNWNTGSPTNEIMIPMGQIRDGKYIQFVKFNGSEGSRRNRWRNLKDKLSVRLNKVGKGKIPYATFCVKDGKLNGQACFFNGYGDTIEKGNYQNNLKHGIWYEGPDMINYKTYADGVLNGISLKEMSRTKFRRLVYKDRQETFYKDGKLIKTKKWWIKGSKEIYVEKERIDSFSYPCFTYQKFVNNKLVENGQASEYDSRMGTCYFYYPESGKLAGVIQAESEDMYNDDLFHFWAKNIFLLDTSSRSLRLYGIESRYSNGSIYGECFSFDEYQSYDQHKMIGDGVQYYENGQRMISYHADRFQIIVDTLFYENGQPKYVTYSDDESGEYVAHYFNKEGKLIREFEKTANEFTNKLNYKGHELSRDSKGPYFYNAYPDFDSISNPENGIIYTFIEADEDRLIKEFYYDTRAKTQVNYYDLRNDEEELNYSLEINLVYNHDYTAAAVTRTTKFGDHYKTVCSYDLQYHILYPFQKNIKNIVEYQEGGYYDLQNYGMLSYIYQDYGVEPRTTYHDPIFSISNLQTTYFLDDKPITAKFSLDQNKRKSKIEIGKNKITLNCNRVSHEIYERHELSYDRFGLQTGFIKSQLVPDLFAKIPGVYIQYQQNHVSERYQSYVSAVSKIEGQFVSGKLHGKWKAYNYWNDLVAEINFVDGTPIGEARFYVNPSGTGRPFISNSIWFEDGLPTMVAFMDWEHDTLLALEYINGVPHSLKQFSYIYRPTKACYQIKTGTFLNGELVAVGSTSFGFGDHQKKEISLSCLDGFFHGPFEMGSDSGYFDRGRFNGIQKVDDSYGRLRIIEVGNGYVLSRKCFNEDKQLLWQINYDTTEFKTAADLIHIFEFFPWSRFPYDTTNIYNEIRHGDYKDWYPDGSLSSQGDMILNTYTNIRCGDWKYYSPEGNLLTTVTYSFGNDSAVYFYSDSILYKNLGDLKSYKDNLVSYDAKILSYHTEYNCDIDQNYEIRVLYIERDYLPDGSVVEQPTRYHTNYFDFGVIQSEGQLVEGMPDGLWKFYDSKGGLNEMGQFKKGKKQGIWFTGDLAGINFLGDYCLNPDAINIEDKLSDLEKDLKITITTYLDGQVMKITSLSGYKNN